MADLNEFINELMEQSFSFNNLLNDYKRNYIAYKINENNNANYKMYMRDYNDLESVLTNMFLLKNNIELKKEKNEKTLDLINKKLELEKKMNDKLNKNFQSINNSDLGAEQLVYDKSEEYNIAVMKLVFYIIGYGLMFLAYKRISQ